MTSAETRSERTPLAVRLVGARLHCLAWGALLDSAPQLKVMREPSADAWQPVLLLIGIPNTKHSLDALAPGEHRGVVLLTDGAPGEMMQGISRGVDVFVSPEDSLEGLVKALEAGAQGCAHCSMRLLPQLLDVVRHRSELNRVPGNPRVLLSRREEEIARLVASGLTNGQIACQLHVEERTIKSHLTSVYSKLAVEGRRDLRARWSELKAAPALLPCPPSGL